MAANLTKEELKNLDTIPYKKIRPYLKTGQIIFFSGSYLFSGIIRKLTKSVFSHVAIIYKDEQLDRVMILEAEPYIGIRLIPFSKYINDYKDGRPYKGQIVVSNFMYELTQDQKNEAISFGLDELSRPYDNWEIFRIMLRILFRIGKKERNRDYICSELVRSCYAKAGYLFKMNDSYVSPQEIWEDENIELKYRVH
jgi:uncharacterized protein YycO